mgnify:FL=1
MGIPPSKMPDEHELVGYTVWNQVWKETGLELMTFPEGSFLCIGCLEEKLDRKLTPTDFDSDDTTNFCTSGILTYLFPEGNNSPQVDGELKEVQRKFIVNKREEGTEHRPIPEDQLGIVSQRLADQGMQTRLEWWRNLEPRSP